MIVLKCVAGRDKDRHDVVAMLAARGDALDLEYLPRLLAALREALAEDEIVRFFDAAWASANAGNVEAVMDLLAFCKGPPRVVRPARTRA